MINFPTLGSTLQGRIAAALHPDPIASLLGRNGQDTYCAASITEIERFYPGTLYNVNSAIPFISYGVKQLLANTSPAQLAGKKMQINAEIEQTRTDAKLWITPRLFLIGTALMACAFVSPVFREEIGSGGMFGIMASALHLFATEQARVKIREMRYTLSDVERAIQAYEKVFSQGSNFAQTHPKIYRGMLEEKLLLLSNSKNELKSLMANNTISKESAKVFEEITKTIDDELEACAECFRLLDRMLIPEMKSGSKEFLTQARTASDLRKI